VRLRYDGSVRPWICFVLAGCNQVFGLDPTAVKMADAGIDAPGCSGAQFGNPQPVASTVFTAPFDPSASGDPNEVWFTRDMNGYLVSRATRPSETAPFDTIIDYSTTTGDFDPALSADATTLAFVSNRTGSYVFATTRASRGAAFGPALQVAPIGDATQGIDLSFDGTTIYFSDVNRVLRAVHRASPSDAWTGNDEVLAMDVEFPSVSPDGLELYYANAGNVYRRTRTSTSLAFDANPALILSMADDADVWPDSEHLYVHTANDLVVLTRSCN
jgi:hypothetical protein